MTLGEQFFHNQRYKEKVILKQVEGAEPLSSEDEQFQCSDPQAGKISQMRRSHLRSKGVLAPHWVHAWELAPEVELP